MSTILLYPNTYIHVLNQDTGEIRTEVGPKRLVLSGNEKEIGGVKDAIILERGNYCFIKNPYDEKKFPRELICG